MAERVSRRTLAVGLFAAGVVGQPVAASARLAEPRIDRTDYYRLTTDDMLSLRDDANAFRGQLVMVEGDLDTEPSDGGFKDQDIDGSFDWYLTLIRRIDVPGGHVQFYAYIVSKKKSDFKRHGPRDGRVYGEVVGTFELPSPIGDVYAIPVIEQHLIEPVGKG